MLVLSRKPGEKIRIGTDVYLTVVAVKGNRVTLGIDAPREVNVQRGELVLDGTPSSLPIPVAGLMEATLAASVAG